MGAARLLWKSTTCRGLNDYQDDGPAFLIIAIAFWISNVPQHDIRNSLGYGNVGPCRVLCKGCGDLWDLRPRRSSADGTLNSKVLEAQELSTLVG